MTNPAPASAAAMTDEQIAQQYRQSAALFGFVPVSSAYTTRATFQHFARALLAQAVPAQVETAQQKLAQEYRRNILEGVANWMRSRHSTIWATELGYTGLMETWADELDQIRRELGGAADAAKTGGEIRNVEGSGWLVDPIVELADGVTLSAEDAHFLAVRLRRLCEHLKYALPKFAEDDAALVNIAGTVIGAVLANMTNGVHTPDPFIEHFAKEEATQPHSYDAGGVQERVRYLRSDLAQTHTGTVHRVTDERGKWVADFADKAEAEAFMRPDGVDQPDGAKR